MQPLLVDTLQMAVEGRIVGFFEFIPTLLAAALILALGIAVGIKLEPLIVKAGRRVDLDEKVRQTPFAALFGDGSAAVSKAFGVLVKYYVILIGAFAAVELIALQFVAGWFLTAWAHDLLAYVPPIVLGILVLFVGFYLASYAADQVRQSPAARETGLSPFLAGGTKAFLYFLVLVIGLDTMGVDVAILHTFAEAFAYAAGLAAALAIGIAFGWGGKDYVAEHLDEWLENSKSVASESDVVSDD